MALKHTRPFRVRTYECDALGHVNNAVYQQYLQEAAIDAATAAGYPPEWFRERGLAWVVRQMSLEYLRPAVAGDELNVLTWLSSSSKVRARREYEIRRASDDALIARASASWVYFDLANGRPRAIPPEFAADFEVGGGVALAPPGPPGPGIESGAFRWRHRVAHYELDPNQHVNNAVYLNWVEEAKFRAAALVGWPPERVRSENVVIVQVRHDTEYFLPARYGDEIEVVSRIHDLRRVRGTWVHEIRRVGTGELLARNYSSGAFLDLGGRPTRPPRAMLDALLAGEGGRALGACQENGG